MVQCLQTFPYERTCVYLHSDPALMPRDRRLWSSVNCIQSADSNAAVLIVTPVLDAFCPIGFKVYCGICRQMGSIWMNRVTAVGSSTSTELPLFQSVNPICRPAKDKMLVRVRLAAVSSAR